MWYLITFEDRYFAKVQLQDGGELSYKLRNNNGEPLYEVHNERKYIIEVDSGNPEESYLNTLCALNPRWGIPVSYGAVLLRWKDSQDILIDKLEKIFDKKDKYLIVSVSEMLVSNFLPLDYLNNLDRKDQK